MRSRKNILIRVFPRCGLSSQASLFVTGLDKSQVFPISLNRKKSAGKPTGSIRRKFSIDDACAIAKWSARASTISKPYRKRFSKPGIHHLRQMQRPAMANLLAARALCGSRAEPLAFA
jgi:hypothetical protein